MGRGAAEAAVAVAAAADLATGVEPEAVAVTVAEAGGAIERALHHLVPSWMMMTGKRKEGRCCVRAQA